MYEKIHSKNTAKEKNPKSKKSTKVKELMSDFQRKRLTCIIKRLSFLI